MAAKEIVLALRLSEGTTREQFRALKGALIDVRDEITQNNKALRENAKEQRALDVALAKGALTAEQAAVRSQVLTTQREQLKNVSANLASAEASLAAQYRESKNDVGGLTDAGLRFRDKMADATIEALKQEGVLGQARCAHGLPAQRTGAAEPRAEGREDHAGPVYRKCQQARSGGETVGRADGGPDFQG
jgi:hypothetical protein